MVLSTTLLPAEALPGCCPASASGRQLLLEASRDQWVDWRTECAAVQATFHRWCRATQPADRALAYALYRMALDEEERASVIYLELLAATDAQTRLIGRSA